MSSQALVSVSLLVVLCLFSSIKECLASQSEKNVALPVTGASLPVMKPFEEKFVSLLTKWSVPGASLCLSKRGKIIYSRGFGWADYSKQAKVQPDSLFRIASISKSITAVAALKLVDQGKLKLDEKAFAIIDDVQALNKQKMDPRIRDITVKDLLCCTGGWSAKDSGDPLFMPHLEEAARATGVESPPDLKTLIKYWLDRPLDFTPGQSWGYTNFGYTLLGEIITRRAGQPYEKFVTEKVLAPAGITKMRVGKTLEAFPNEVVSYPYPGQPLGKSIYPSVKEQVNWQYGGDFEMETIGPAAGWISSSVDLVKFANALHEDRSGTPGLLTSRSFQEMLRKPNCPFWKNKVGYFAMGWEVYPVTSGSGYTFSRVGTLPGNMAFLVKRYDDTCWAVEFNSRPEDSNRFIDEAKKLIWQEIDRPAARTVLSSM